MLGGMKVGMKAAAGCAWAIALGAGCWGDFYDSLRADATDSLTFLSLRVSHKVKLDETKTVAGRKGKMLTKKIAPRNIFIDVLVFRGPAEVMTGYDTTAKASCVGQRIRAGLEFPLYASEDGRSEAGASVGVLAARQTVSYTAAGGEEVEVRGQALLTPILVNAPELYARVKLSENADLRVCVGLAPFLGCGPVELEELALTVDYRLSKTAALSFGWRSLVMTTEFDSGPGESLYYDSYDALYWSDDAVTVEGSGLSFGLVVTY